MLYKEAVSEKLLEVLHELMNIPDLKDFRLVGGTALALQLNHRESVDIDLFSYKSFPKDVKKKVFDAFDTFRHDELQAKIEEMKKRK